MRRIAFLAALWLPQGEPTELPVLASAHFDDPLIPRERRLEGGWDVGSMSVHLWTQGGVVAVPGVSGGALRFDGVTGHCELRNCEPSPEFTFEIWLALAAYPPAWCTIASQWRDERGWRVDLGPQGELHFELASSDRRIQRATTRPFPLKRWTHLVATCGPHPALTRLVDRPETTLRLYVDAREVGGGARSSEPPEFVLDEPLRIGAPSSRWFDSNLESRPTSSAALPDPAFGLDGAVDELRIYRGAMSRDEVRRRFESVSVGEPPLPERRLPDGPAGPGAFGAVACSLPYSPDWDALRDEGPAPDVVVRFDSGEARFVFWGGLSHEPLLVAQDGLRAIVSLFSTRSGLGECFPFFRRHEQPSSVRIRSSHPARVVLDCRRQAGATPLAPFEDSAQWIHDTWTIYPDACGGRRTTLPDAAKSQLRIALSCVWEPGQDPCDLVNEDFLALSGVEGNATIARFGGGEQSSGSWNVPGPDGYAIQVLNLKSAMRPFLALDTWGACWILEPETSALDEAPRVDVSWNSSSGTEFSWAFGGGVGPYVLPGGAEFKPRPLRDDPASFILLFGMRPEGDDVQSLARGWARPPELVLTSADWRSLGWDRSQRAWVIGRVELSRELAFRVEANEASPMVRPALVVRGWGESEVDVTIDGELAREGADYRQGLERQLGPTDLVVWLDRVSTRPVDVAIAARE